MRLNGNPTSKAPPDRSLMGRHHLPLRSRDSCCRRVKRNLEAVVKPVINCRLDSVFGQIHELQYVTKKNGATVQEKKIPSSVNRTIINRRPRDRPSAVQRNIPPSSMAQRSPLTEVPPLNSQDLLARVHHHVHILQTFPHILTMVGDFDYSVVAVTVGKRVGESV
jgi:hypothetical protein